MDLESYVAAQVDELAGDVRNLMDAANEKDNMGRSKAVVHLFN